ncbi:MAG TPA: hypothetical protein VMU43_13485 [Candidatus Acidoferrum sp.]|nr:hypothetical protein [Candidatus Acidoferrum sp.]
MRSEKSIFRRARGPQIVPFSKPFVVALLLFILSGCTGRSLGSGSPVLAVSPATLSFSADLGHQLDPLPAEIHIANAGTGSLTFSASTDSGWLAVTPTGGNAPQALQVTAMIGALKPGTYTGNVIIQSAGVSGSPAKVGVKFTVAPARSSPPQATRRTRTSRRAITS